MSSTNSSRGQPPAAFIDDPVTAYAQSVTRGETLACKWVRLACSRHLRDLAEGHKRGLRWDLAAAKIGIDFFPLLRHSKGEWAGRPMVLEPWQKFGIGSVWGWKGRDGLRRFRTAYEEIPKKNGKSTKAAGIGLLVLVADGEPGAEVYSAATKRDQARILFDEAKAMVRSSALLAKRIQSFKLNLSIAATNSKFEPLSSDARTADGVNPQLVLVDELHRHRSRALLDLMDDSSGSRRQPLLWIITTAGDDDPESPYAHERHYAEQILEGALVDDSYFAFIATLDEGDRWDDPAVWIKANPNLGVSIKLADLERRCRKAKGSPVVQASFKRFRLNLRTSSRVRAINMDEWMACAGPSLDPRNPPADLEGRDCALALDLSSKLDISAMVLAFPPRPDVTRDPWRVLCRFWIPENNVEAREDRDRAPYRRWIEEGWLETTRGNSIDHGVIRDAALEAAKLYSVLVAPFDPWNAAQISAELGDEGLQVVEFIQGIKSYTKPTKEFLTIVGDGLLAHGNNPVLTWMASNLVTESDKNLNLMPHKKHSRGRIDGICALIMAIGGTLAGVELSPYETQPLIVAA